MPIGAGLVPFLGLILSAAFFQSQAQADQNLDLSATKIRDRIQAAGFIFSGPLPAWGMIVGGKGDAVNLSEGEFVYLRLEPEKRVKPGDQFFLARPQQVVVHPLTHERIGHLVVIPGKLTIVEGKDDLVLARIQESLRPVYLGDLILSALPAPVPALPIRTFQTLEGVVIASLEDAKNLTEREIIYINRGRQDGVIVGDLFSILQRGNYPTHLLKEGDKLPWFKVGGAVVVGVQTETATALITHTSRAVYVGDKIIFGRE